MITVVRRVVAKQRGRPKKGENDGTTRHVRVFDDMAERIAWIVKVEGGSSAQLLDPMIRDHINERYEAIKQTVDVIKRAMERRRKASAGEE